MSRWSIRILLALLSLFLLIACGTANKGDDDDAAADDDTSPAADDAADNDNDNANDANDDNDNDDDTTPDTPGTKYPIVLMHGFFGWGDLGAFSYFAGVVDDLTAKGYTVIEPAVSPVNSMEERAGEWVEKINAAYGPNKKINIIAHSQGGLDARYMISTLGWGDRVGALVTVATPHQGTGLSDVVMGVIPGFGQDIIDWIMNMLGLDWDGIVQLSHDYVQNEFNPANPDDPRVTYISYQTDAADNCFFLLEPTHWLLELVDGANDGVVPTASGAYGIEMGIESADHWSIIGQPLGLANFDQLTFYGDIAQLLRDHGF